MPTASVDPSQAQPKQTARASKRQRRRQRGNLWVWIAGGAAIILVLALIIINNVSQTASGAPPQSDIPAELVSGLTMGSPDATVTVMEFSDFMCPHCKTFAEGAAQQLKEEYVKPGLIQFEFKPFPLPSFEPGASRAANAAACAADQGKFWEMHDYLFQIQNTRGANTFTESRMRSMASDLGLDSGDFDSCLSRRVHEQEIRDSVNLGRQMGVTGTPSVFVNGQRVDSSYGAIKAAIDAALAQQGGG